MRILLIGGSGLLGTALRRLWTQHAILAPGHEALDIFDDAALKDAIETAKPEWIVNCAAYNNVDAAEGADHDLAIHLNAEAPEHLARAAASQNIPFIHFSTDYVFDGSNIEGYSEQDVARSGSVYGQSKRLGEQGALRVQPNSYIIRTSRLYGSKAESANAKRSFPEIIFDDARKAARILVNGREVSAPTFVDDLARHVETHILQAKPEPGIYHISNTGGATWFEWAAEIGRVLNLPATFAPRDPASLRRPAPRPAHSVLRSTKLPPMRPWRDALQDFLLAQNWKFEPLWKSTGIDGATVEPQPRIGEQDGAVLHMIPGGTKNPHGFGPDILDIYASTARGKNTFRGGHYHLKLDELFFQMSGTALWLLSDFREDSATFGKTAGVVIGIDRDGLVIPSDIPSYFLSDGSSPRLRIPAGVYHAFFPLTDERVTVVGVGSTSYDKEDYRYPKLEEIPNALNLLKKFGI
jgi:dTDP-4-dehydrorhamnose reductase